VLEGVSAGQRLPLTSLRRCTYRGPRLNLKRSTRVRLDPQRVGPAPHPVTVTEKSVRVARLRPVPVMLAAPIPALPRRGAFRRLSAEPKYDGYRVLLLRYDDRCVLQSRRGTDLSRSFPELVAAAVEQVPDETILDGEIVVGVEGRLDFAELQKRVAAPARAVAWARERPATFLAFDLLVLDEQVTSIASSTHPWERSRAGRADRGKSKMPQTSQVVLQAPGLGDAGAFEAEEVDLGDVREAATGGRMADDRLTGLMAGTRSTASCTPQMG
jgi:hypothetical protein